MLMHPALMDLGRDVSVLWVTLLPRASTGAHNHPEQAEFEYMASGQGTLESGQEKLEVEANVPVFNPPGLQQNIINTGNETIYLLRFHVPALPEGQRMSGKSIEAAKRSRQS